MNASSKLLAWPLLLALSMQASAADLKSATEAWGQTLAKHVRPLGAAAAGGVDYQGLAKDLPQLEVFLAAHKDLDPAPLSENARKAAYINLYNAGMLYNLLRYVRSEKIDVKGSTFLQVEINAIKVPGGNIWNGDYQLPFAGSNLNLDSIEHGLLRGKTELGNKLDAYKVKDLDPRIHAAVNCAALSCPRVREQPYTEANVDAMLDENMREYLSSEAQFSKADAETMRANQIVYWYYADFDDHGKTLGKGGAGGYLAGFVEPTAKDHDWKVKHLRETFNDRSKVSLKLSSAYDFHYDWRINDVRNRSGS